MENKHSSDHAGDKFYRAFQDAMSTKDFHEFNEMIAGSVKSAVNEVKPQVKSVLNDVGASVQSAVDDAGFSFQQAFRDVKEQFGGNGFIRNRRADAKKTVFSGSRERSVSPRVRFRVKQVGAVSGVISITIGGIGVFVTGVAGLFWLIAALAAGTFWLGTAIPILCILIFFVYLVGLGIWSQKRLRRVKRYVELCDGKPYINIADLATQYGKSIRFVRNDIVKILSSGFFPEGHLDQAKTCLMLTDSSYREYLQLEKERLILEEQRKASEVPPADEDCPVSNGMPEDIREMLEQGNRYIHRIHLANDRLPGAVVSYKLDRLEKLLLQIFDRIRNRNLEASKMEQFMDYYLPTTLKLVDAYEEFDRVDAASGELLAAKSEIEQALDTIIEAFNQVLTNLYRDAVFDATTDAQVLQSMLVRGGLTGGNDMKQ
jgi:hypothetical protein